MDISVREWMGQEKRVQTIDKRMVDSWEEENKRMRRMKRKNPLQLWGRLKVKHDASWIGFITPLVS